MALESNIASIVATYYPDASFLLASKFQAKLTSFDLETSELPFIVLDNELPKTAEIKKNSNVQKDTRVLLYFLDYDNPENTDAQTLAIQNAMEVIADNIAFRIWQLEKIRPGTNQRYKITPVFKWGASTLSGVVLDYSLNENMAIEYINP